MSGGWWLLKSDARDLRTSVERHSATAVKVLLPNKRGDPASSRSEGIIFDADDLIERRSQPLIRVLGNCLFVADGVELPDLVIFTLDLGRQPLNLGRLLVAGLLVPCGYGQWPRLPGLRSVSTANAFQ